MRDYPFTILDVAGILNLKVRRRQPTNMDVDCPFCGHKKGKMNLNFAKNVFRCNYCGESGGMIELYSKVFQISNAQAFAEICEILHDGRKADALPKPIYTPDMENNPCTAYLTDTGSGLRNTASDLFHAAFTADFIKRPSEKSYGTRSGCRADCEIWL